MSLLLNVIGYTLMIVIMSPPIPHLRDWHSLPDPTFAPQPVFDLCKKC